MISACAATRKGEKMRLSQRVKIFSVVACVLVALIGCVVKDSPAPGCVETIGLPAMGGCFGKTAIIDLQVLSAPGCVVVKANNCNGGVLDVRNDCAETIRLGSVEIPPAGYAILDIVENGGKPEVIQISSNFSQYKPGSDQQIDLEGLVGDQSFRITFIKTKPLCE